MADVVSPGRQARFSIPSLAAVLTAAVSFFLSAGWGFFLALLAIPLGLIGFIMALSPRIRGGLVSVLSLLAGALGVIVALIKLILPG